MFGLFSVRHLLFRMFHLSVLWLLKSTNDFHKVFFYFPTETSQIHNAYSTFKHFENVIDCEYILPNITGNDMAPANSS